MKHFFFALFALLIPAMGMSLQADETNDPIRMLSFNIRYNNPGDGENTWNKRKEFVLDIMLGGNYDFFGLQEVLVRPESELSQMDDLEKHLPEYGFVVRSREKNPEQGESAPIFYNKAHWELDANENGTFWLSETPEIAGSSSWGSACNRVTTWGRFTNKKTGKSLYLFNTHLDHISEQARKQGCRLITDMISKRKHSDEPVFLLGDFNCSEKSPAIRFLQGDVITLDGAECRTPEKLADTFRVFCPDGDEQGTFHGFSGKPGKDKIDYIFATSGVKVLSSAILDVHREGRYPSDHFPLEAEVEFSK